MEVLIIGGGKLVYFLARSFVAKGYNVCIITRDAAEADWLARRLKAIVIFGDGTRPGILKEAEISRKDMVLAVSPYDEDNFIACQLAEKVFKVPLVFALANDPANEKLFPELGVKALFSPSRLLSSLIEQRTASESVVNLFPFGDDGRVTLTEIIIPANSPAVFRSLKDIELPESSLVAGIIRKGEAIIPRGNTILLPLDRLIVSALPDVYAAVLRALVGK